MGSGALIVIHMVHRSSREEKLKIRRLDVSRANVLKSFRRLEVAKFRREKAEEGKTFAAMFGKPKRRLI